jgi:heptosyltransferase II
VSPFSPSSIQRILITRLRFLGDVVLTTPLIRALRQRFPQAHLAYLSEKPYGEILQHNPHLNALLTLEQREIASLPLSRRAFAQAGFIRALREEKYDLVIDLFGNPRSGLLTYLSGAKGRFGPARRGRAVYYTKLIPGLDRPHTQIEAHLEFIKPLGIEPSEISHRTEVFLSEEEKAWARSYLKEHGLTHHPLILLHPGASWPAKRWFPERFAQIAEKLRKEVSATIVLLCGPDETPVIGEVVRKMTNKPHVADGLPVKKLCALLSACDLSITNDAGPMHIACALGIPTLALFGPGDPATWFPYNEAHQVAIHHPPSCWPCHLDVCDKMDCMKTIAIEEVIKEAKQLLSLHPTSYALNPEVLCPT